MPFRIISGDATHNYPSRLAQLERRIRIIEWMLILPGVIQLFRRQRFKPLEEILHAETAQLEAAADTRRATYTVDTRDVSTYRLRADSARNRLTG